MVRIAVAEDEREFRDTCAGFIRRYCEENGVQAEVTVFEDGMDLLDCQEEKGEIWDILFRQNKSTGWTKEDRARLSYAATSAGIAIDYTGTGFPHPLGYCLTLTRGIPHGEACAVFEGAFLTYNRLTDAGTVRTDRLAEALGTTVEEMIERIPEKSGIHLSIDPEEREALIDRVSGAGNYANSPYVISRGEMSDIFKRLFG